MSSGSEDSRDRDGTVTETATRRDRARAATTREIKDTARRLLVAGGAEALSLRAIARDMGMTAPALYRYFPSREDLVAHLIGDLYRELDGALEAARDAEPAADTPGRLLAASRAFRHWALGHPREFGLLFGSPIPGVLIAEKRPDGATGNGVPTEDPGLRFGRVFGDLVARIYQERPFPVLADEEMDPPLRAQLARWSDALPVPLPLGVAQVFLSCWIRLYGMVSMEVFHHLKFALADAGPMFESELRDLARVLGVPDRDRSPGSRSGR